MSAAELGGDGPAADLRGRYEALRNLLDRNGALLELMAEVELDLRMPDSGDPGAWARMRSLLEGALLQSQTLNLLADQRYGALYRIHRRIEHEVWRILRGARDDSRNAPLAVRLREATREDGRIVGGKAARLGDLASAMPESVPEGFVVTTAAYARFMAHRQAGSRLRETLRDLDVIADRAQLRTRLERARALVLGQEVPEEVGRAIVDATRRWGDPRPGWRWAVRSSAVGEDGPLSFAGQFDSLLDVPPGDVVESWRRVVASALSQRAVAYRLASGLPDLATPMAVLCMPMVDARWAGVMHTRDPAGVERETMVITAVEGLGSGLVGGAADGETFRVSRGEPVREEARSLADSPRSGSRPLGLPGETLSALVALGRAAEDVLGEALEVEWAVETDGRPFLLQARPLSAPGLGEAPRAEVRRPPLAEGGTPIVTGRAVGPVCCVGGWVEGDQVPEGSVLVVPQATPELGHLLPRVEGLIAERGSVAGHLASLARASGVPSVFGMAGAASRLPGGQLVSLDAGRCRAYAGDVWPDEAPARRRLERELRAAPKSPLHDLVLRLELTDPRAPTFRPGGCRSIHDLVRFCHERGIAAVFEPGAWKDRPEHSGAQRLIAPRLPNQIWVLDTGGGVAAGARGRPEVAPADVASLPFRGLWRGITAPGVSWSGRSGISLRGFASVVSSSLLEPGADPGELAAAAYMIVASDSLNFNARLAYHYAMVDARVGEVPENNHVRFRFWGGGARPAQRDLRALLLARVLRSLGFAVERRGDLVAAAFQRYPAERSEQVLEALGKLMGCARQLDMLLDTESRVEHYVQRFLAGDYEAFK